MLVFGGFESFLIWFDFVPSWLEHLLRVSFLEPCLHIPPPHLHWTVLLVFCEPSSAVHFPGRRGSFPPSSSSSPLSALPPLRCPQLRASPFQPQVLFPGRWGRHAGVPSACAPAQPRTGILTETCSVSSLSTLNEHLRWSLVDN